MSREKLVAEIEHVVNELLGKNFDDPVLKDITQAKFKATSD
jgi:uncharacterized protein (UPF0335 family)